MITLKKCFSFLVFPLLLILLLTSCGFVTYVPDPENDSEAARLLEEARENYLSLLDTLSDPSYYDSTHLREYEAALLDARNELNECLTREALEAVYNKHASLIAAIPIDRIRVIGELLDELNTLADFSLYREAEQALLQALFTETSEAIQTAATILEAENALRLFKIELYELKTDAAYTAEELTALKSALSVRFSESIDYGDYRAAEQERLCTWEADFADALEQAETQEQAQDVFDRYQSHVASLSTLQSLLEAEKNEQIEAWAEELYAFAQDNPLTNENITACLTEMEAMDSLVALHRHGAETMLNAAETLEARKSAAARLFPYLYDPDAYREEERAEAAAMLARFAEALETLDSDEALEALLVEAQSALAALPTEDTLWEREDNAFLSELEELYGEAHLTLPTRLNEASDRRELAAIIDTYAFYQTSNTAFLRSTFRVKLLYAHKSAQFEINEVYWYCELLRSAVGITGYLEGRYLVLELIPYALATESNVEEPIDIDRYDSLVEFDSDKSTLTPRGEDFEDFPYLSLYEKTLSGVWNTQQLWYALEHEYIPLPVQGSPAEKALERAKEILREVVADGMSTEEKVFAIYSWFGQYTTYDNDYGAYLYPTDRTHFPDSLAATLDSFHADGVFQNNIAVCCAFAKSYLILLRMEGIEAYRICVRKYTDNAIDNLGQGGYGSHAFIAFRASDGLFYYSDTEQAYNTAAESFLVKFHQMATTAATRWPYESGWTQLFPELVFGESLPSLLSEKLVYNQQSVFVTDEESLQAMLDAFDSEDREHVQISVFQTAETPFSIREILEADGRFLYTTFSYGGITEYLIYR